jgi:hypothetical protein
MKLQPLLPSILAPAAALILASCGNQNAPETTSTLSDKEATSIPASLFVETPPEGALSVVEARAQAQPGATLTLRGKVGGKMNPLSDAAALLVLADEKAIKSCDVIPGDSCPTPWDYCCEDPGVISASTTTIQVTGEDGKLLRSTLRGAGDIKELSRLVVTGTVDAASTEAALIVNADKIYVEKP